MVRVVPERDHPPPPPRTGVAYPPPLRPLAHCWWTSPPPRPPAPRYAASFLYRSPSLVLPSPTRLDAPRSPRGVSPSRSSDRDIAPRSVAPPSPPSRSGKSPPRRRRGWAARTPPPSDSPPWFPDAPPRRRRRDGRSLRTTARWRGVYPLSPSADSIIRPRFVVPGPPPPPPPPRSERARSSSPASAGRRDRRYRPSSLAQPSSPSPSPGPSPGREGDAASTARWRAVLPSGSVECTSRPRRVRQGSGSGRVGARRGAGGGGAPPRLGGRFLRPMRSRFCVPFRSVAWLSGSGRFVFLALPSLGSTVVVRACAQQPSCLLFGADPPTDFQPSTLLSGPSRPAEPSLLFHSRLFGQRSIPDLRPRGRRSPKAPCSSLLLPSRTTARGLTRPCRPVKKDSAPLSRETPEPFTD